MQMQDEAEGSLVRDLRTWVIAHGAGCREITGPDVALARYGSARLIDEGTIRPYPGQDTRDHEVPDLGPEHALR